MKKILLGFSIAAFGIALVMSWFFSIYTGVIMTLVLGSLIAFCGYLINNNPKLWISVLMFVISLGFLVWGTANVTDQTIKTKGPEIGIVAQTECDSCHPVHLEIAE